MTKRVASGAWNSLPENYDGLCVKVWMPRRLKDGVDLSNVVEIIDRLTSRRRLTEGQEEYLDFLSDLVEIYEQKAFPLQESTPLEALEFLLQQNDMSPADLSRLLGDDSRSLGTRILSGERELSKEHIRTLAVRFKVTADLFLG